MRKGRMGGQAVVTRAKRRRGIPEVGFAAVLCLLALATGPRWAGAEEPWAGQRIMEEVFRRQRLLPYVYEELTLILKDGAGNRDVRKARHFFRAEEDGTLKYLLVLDTPAEVRGVALLKVDHPSGPSECGIYLPAFGKRLLSPAGKNRGEPFLDTDFTIGDLTPEAPADFRYVRVADQKVDLAPCYVVEVVPQNEETERATGYGLRRHFIRQDIFLIVRTDYYDPRRRFFKRQTFHDPTQVQGDLWEAGMALMENRRERHETLIKTDRRVVSRDYVPPEIFTPAWLLENRHIHGTGKRLFQKEPPLPRESDEAGSLRENR